jgi:hypothetical protein
MAKPYTGHPWTRPEVNHASSLYGEVPPSVAFADYNRWASANGYPPRTQRALEEKMASIGVSCRCRDSWQYLTAKEIADLLGIGVARLYSWRDRIGFPLRQSPWKYGRNWYAERDELARYLRRNPHLLMGRPVDGINWLVEDWPMGYKLAALPTYRRSNLRHFAGGLRFDSIKQLHQHFNITP